jgi:cell division septation protein DedD
MNAKLGGTLMLAAVGGLAFLAGVAAPDSLRSSLPILGAAKPPAAAPALTSADSAAAATPTTAAPAFSAANPASAAASAAAASAPPAAAKPDPILLESLQVPVSPPAGGKYALQAGQFASEDVAIALGARIKQQKLPFDQTIKTVDQGGKIWYIVPIGPYATLDEARAARTQVALKLDLSGGLPAIMLPPPPPPAKT